MVANPTPLSLRLPPLAEELISAEARRTHRSRGAVVVALAVEALKARMFPGIAFRGDDYERRPWLIGTAFDVWQVVEGWRDFGSVERMVEETDLEERQVRLALAYYERFGEEIDQAIADNRQPLSALRSTFPTVTVIEYDG